MRKTMHNQVNAAFQIIPRAGDRELYPLVDKAIGVIAASGLQYRVCPFETVVEGPLDRVLALVPEILARLYGEGVEEVISFLKIQSRKDGDVSIGEKMEKYGG